MPNMHVHDSGVLSSTIAWFGLPPRCRWDLRSSGLLRSV